MERYLTFKIEKEFDVNVEDFAYGLEQYFDNVLSEYCGLDKDEIEEVDYIKLELAVIRYWTMELAEKGLTF